MKHMLPRLIVLLAIAVLGGGAEALWGTGPNDPPSTTQARAGSDWWSLQPVVRPQPPRVRDLPWPANGIDAFVLAKLESKGLRPAPPTDRRTIIRRLSFDLLGLPPTPEEIAAFVADDSPDAYERLVDRLLDAPHYGERWARHWLDVVRFGESQGFERDKLRPNAWRYRDWVIQALNDDMPYDEFVRQQIAGDVLRPDDPAAILATGFLVAAPWDEVGQMQQSAAMKAVVRQDELEDIVGVTAQTFLGLTANCARCHDHKFDPITQVDYYRLVAALDGVRHGERQSLTDSSQAQSQRRAEELEPKITAFRKQLADIDEPVRRRVLAIRASQPRPKVAPPQPIARWEFDGDLKDSVGSLQGTAQGAARIEGGRLLLDGSASSFVATEPLTKDLKEKTLEAWVSLTNDERQGGGVISVQSLDGVTFDAIVFGEREPGQWMAGSNGFARTQSFTGPRETEAKEKLVHVALVYHADATIIGYRDGQPYGNAYQASGPVTFEAGKAQVVFGLRHSPAGGNKMLAGSIERAQLYDRALTPHEVAESAGIADSIVSDDCVIAGLTLEARARRVRLLLELSRLESQRRLVAGGPCYAIVPKQPELCQVLERGDARRKKEVVAAGGIVAVSAKGNPLPPAPLPRGERGGGSVGRIVNPSYASHQGGEVFSADFGLAPDAPEADRRIKLAAWITDPRNPLTARVIANRLWHYHFGVGIVDTPNDFGWNGGRPSHPELLDWLASELIHPSPQPSPPRGEGVQSGPSPPGEEGLQSAPSLLGAEGRGEGSGDRQRTPRPWSLKHLHRLIVTSATYRQSSRFNAQADQLDAGNRLLWRHTPQRLDAETLRDAVLAVAGELNPTMGGPGFHDFRTHTNNSQFYEPIDPVGYPFHRRSIYRSWVRSGTNPFLDVFDCPDPSTTAPKRAMTTTPLQALSLLNDSFMLRMAERFADRLQREGGDELSQGIGLAYRLAYARSPKPVELDSANRFVVEHGLAALCRVLFNSNEFLYVD